MTGTRETVVEISENAVTYKRKVLQALKQYYEDEGTLSYIANKHGIPLPVMLDFIQHLKLPLVSNENDRKKGLKQLQKHLT